MERWLRILVPSMFLLLVVLVGTSNGQESDQYQVTIVNLTRGQVITPPLVYTHEESWRVFDEGQIVRQELATLAETGNPGPLKEFLETLLRVYKTTVGDGVIPPGHSATVMIEGKPLFDSLTALGMLAQTNDAFFAVQGIKLPRRGTVVVYANAYDAGSEANNELAPYVPGPPFGGHMREPNGAEGYVHIHAGIQGIGDLIKADYDWRNPVAMIIITRVI